MKRLIDVNFLLDQQETKRFALLSWIGHQHYLALQGYTREFTSSSKTFTAHAWSDKIRGIQIIPRSAINQTLIISWDYMVPIGLRFHLCVSSLRICGKKYIKGILIFQIKCAYVLLLYLQIDRTIHTNFLIFILFIIIYNMKFLGATYLLHTVVVV